VSEEQDPHADIQRRIVGAARRGHRQGRIPENEGQALTTRRPLDLEPGPGHRLITGVGGE
jgi:hypothetical protein